MQSRVIRSVVNCAGEPSPGFTASWQLSVFGIISQSLGSESDKQDERRGLR